MPRDRPIGAIREEQPGAGRPQDDAAVVVLVTRSGTFVSYAQNGEDVVLSRALGHLPSGRYVDVGANHPTSHSVTYAFYKSGWTGLLLEPVPQFAQLLRSERPGDETVEVVVGDEPSRVTFHEVVGTGLSTVSEELAQTHRTAGWTVVEHDLDVRPLRDLVAERPPLLHETHLLKIDVEGAESAVLAGCDFSRWRPWIIVIEATRPLSTVPTHGEWESRLLESGYVFTLFDGLSRYYVAAEHEKALGPALTYPACVLDDYVTHSTLLERTQNSDLSRTVVEAQVSLSAWREYAIELIEQTTADGEVLRSRHAQELESVRAELAASRAEFSALEAGVEARAAEQERRLSEAEELRRQADASQRALALELDRTTRTLSWRVTRPLRLVRGLLRRARRASRRPRR